MKKRLHISQEKVMDWLSYEPATGIFKHRIDCGRRKAGAVAGSYNSYGYIVIRLGGKTYMAHRLAWLYVYGVLPQEIDHINRKRDDNRISNLRDVSHSTNIFNQDVRSDNTSGFRRVSRQRTTGKWLAHITANGKSKHLGTFETPEAAHNAYLKARADLLGSDDVCI